MKLCIHVIDANKKQDQEMRKTIDGNTTYADVLLGIYNFGVGRNVYNNYNNPSRFFWSHLKCSITAHDICLPLL